MLKSLHMRKNKRTYGYRATYSHLWETYGTSWLVRISFTLRVLNQFFQLIALPIAISLIITNLSEQDYEGAKDAVVLFVGLSLTLGVITPLVRYVGMLGENKVYDQATANYFEKLVNLDLNYFNSNLSGYLTAATRQYVDSCIQLVRALRERYIGTILAIVFPLSVIIFLDVRLGLVALGLSLVQASYQLAASRLIAPYRSQTRELFKKNSGRMSDVISNILAVRSNAQEARYVAQVKKHASEESEAFKRRFAIQAKLMGVRELITVLFFMTLLWLTVERMSAGHITLTAAVLIVTYIATILRAIYTLSDDLDEHDDLVDKIIPAFDVLNRVNAIADPLKPEVFKSTQGEIELQHVSFGYEGSESEQQVFSDFSLQIPAGQKLGVVGLSGAGKSTLAKLLLRFNDVDGGEIRIDGLDIRSVKQTDLRTHIAYVPQEPLLLHASIRDNVLLSKPRATDEEALAALKAAHALTFVQRLPEGLDSIVGERGVKLSGGQKQRIAIARAVLREAPIIILDEATSALDSESEQIIKDSFSEILRGKTAIVIAHRLSTLSEMDRIIVIHEGQLVEDGTHDELLDRAGMYAKLWERQLRSGGAE